MGYHIHFAATRNDWLNLFAEAEGDGLLFYPSSVASLTELIPNAIGNLLGLGTAQTGILTLEPFYLAIPADKTIVPRQIELRRGGVRYAVDQQNNADSFIFRPGGLWNEYFIIGEISSLHSQKITTQLRRKAYQHRNGYAVGPECQTLHSGPVFTTDCRENVPVAT